MAAPQMFTTPFAHAAGGGGSVAHGDGAGTDGPQRAPSAARAPSGRPPLPPGAPFGRDGSGRGSARLGSLALDEPWHDNLLPLSPSLDNILSGAGGSGGFDTRPSMLPSRLLSTTAGRLSTANSFDLSWLLGDGAPGEQGAAPAVEDAVPVVKEEGLGGPPTQQVQQAQQAQQTQQRQRRRPASAGPAAALTTALSLQAPAAKRQRRGDSGGSIRRQPSAAELVVGPASPPPQLPAVEPLLLHPTPPAPAGSPLPAPLTPQAADDAQRSRQHAATLAQQQAALARQAAAASAMAAQVGRSADAATAAAAHRYAVQYSAAAQHAAHAASLHQQLSYEHAVLSSAGGGRDSGGLGAAASGSGSMSLSQGLGGGPAAAHYRHLRPAGLGAPASSGSDSEHTAPAGAYLAGLPAGMPLPSAAAAAATAAAAAAAGSLPTSALLGGSLSSFLGGQAPYGGMHAMAAGTLAGAGAYAQRAVPSSQLSPHDKMAVWAAQNAMMAAFHAGSPCPELAAAAAMDSAWGVGAGMAQQFGGPQASALPAFPPMPQVRVCSATPVLRLATQAAVQVAASPAGPADAAAGEGSGSVHAAPSTAGSAQPAAPAEEQAAA